MRDIVVMLLIVVLLGLGIRNAFNAMLLWAWSGFMALDNYLCGPMRGFPYGTTFALMALVLLLIKNKGLTYGYGKGALTVLLLVMLVHSWIVGAAAYSGLAPNAEYVENIAKLTLFCPLLPLVLRSTVRIHALLLVICSGVGIHTALEGLKFISSGGSHIVRSLAKYGDNNHLAVVTVMLIPLLLYLKQHTASKRLNNLMLASVALPVISVIATCSRAGLISLTIFALWQVAISRRKLLGAVMAAAAGVTLLAFAPETWEARMNTTSEAGEDSSFQGGLAAWQISSAIALKHPVTGGGFHVVEGSAVWDGYQGELVLLSFLDIQVIEGVSGGGKAAHSIYFEVLGNQGFVELLIFLSILAAGLYYGVRLWRLRRTGGPSVQWAYGLGRALSGSLLGYMAGSAGVSMANFELPYFLIMVAMISCRLVEQRIASAPQVART